MRWVIAYDIRSTRRRSRVARALERAGLRVQKSVFVAELSPRDLHKLIQQLSSLIDPETDQVAAWLLSQNSKRENPYAGCAQQTIFPDAVVW